MPAPSPERSSAPSPPGAGGEHAPPRDISRYRESQHDHEASSNLTIDTPRLELNEARWFAGGLSAEDRRLRAAALQPCRPAPRPPTTQPTTLRTLSAQLPPDTPRSQLQAAPGLPPSPLAATSSANQSATRSQTEQQETGEAAGPSGSNT